MPVMLFLFLWITSCSAVTPSITPSNSVIATGKISPVTGPVLNYKSYNEPIAIVKLKLAKNQRAYSKAALKGQYFYSLFPVSMFPFFCLKNKDSVERNRYKIVFSEGCETNIGVYTDRFSMDHVQIAVLQYVKLGSFVPWCRTYMLFMLRKNYVSKEWEQERDPLIISMYYNASTKSYFKK